MSSSVVSRNGRQTVDETAKRDRESGPKLRLLSETNLKICSFFNRYFIRHTFRIYLLPCVIYDVLFESCLESSACV